MTYKERFLGGSGDAPATLGAPQNILIIDRTVFKKDLAEKAKLADMKEQNKQQLKAAYGNNWKKHLNIPSRSIGNKIINTF